MEMKTIRLIDLDTLKQNLCGDCAMNFPKECRQIGCTKVDKQDILEALRIPIIDAVPVKHGKWLPKHHYIAGYEFVSGHICSECGNDALNAEGDDFLTDYCPNCGARMDEERREECSR